MKNKIKNIKNLDANSGSIYGQHNVVKTLNPYNCYFIAHYPNGKIVKGNDLFNTGWKELGNGISLLQYKLSNGNIINIPRFKAYMHLVEVSESMEGSRVFHAINIKGLTGKESINYRIILKEDLIGKERIGDIIISKDKEIMKSKYWKQAAV